MTRKIAMLVAMAVALPAAAGELSAEVQAALAGLPRGETLPVMVHLRDRADLGAVGGDRAARRRAAIQALRSRADSSQGPIRSWLEARQGAGGVARFRPLWVVNGLALTATGPVIRLVAALPAVEAVTLDAVAVVPNGTPPAGPPEANVTATHAPELWSLGFTGDGVVVATLDSGADASHPDLASRWRGGANSWFDPYGQHAAPYDPSGHGTWTLGVIVGGDAGGTTIGVAPAPPGSPPRSSATPGRPPPAPSTPPSSGRSIPMATPPPTTPPTSSTAPGASVRPGATSSSRPTSRRCGPPGSSRSSPPATSARAPPPA